MNKRVGVYLSEHSTRLLGALSRDEEPVSVSSRINAVIERYAWLCRASLPEFSDEAWQTLLNVYAGSELTSYSPPYRIASDLMDDRGVIDLAALTQADPDYAALVKTVHGMSQAEQCAILDFCQRFWAKSWVDYPDFGAIKKELMGR